MRKLGRVEAALVLSPARPPGAHVFIRAQVLFSAATVMINIPSSLEREQLSQERTMQVWASPRPRLLRHRRILACVVGPAYANGPHEETKIRPAHCWNKWELSAYTTYDGCDDVNNTTFG
jgi:hypothetical protein